MHIAHVLGYLAERYGGPPRVAQALACQSEKMGLQVSLWAGGSQEDIKELSHSKLPTHIFTVTWPAGWYRAPELCSALQREINNIDIFHLHEFWSWPQYTAARLARKNRIPYLIRPSGVLRPWMLSSKSGKKKLYMQLFGRRIIDSTACFHAITDIEANELLQAGFQKPVTVIPNGVDMEALADLPVPNAAEEKWPMLHNRRMVLFLSRLSREKGLDQLLPAWSELTKKDSYSDAILVLAGPDYHGYQSQVQEMIHRYRLDNHILLTGMVRGEDKLTLLSRADFYTQPSYSEGFSMSILENLAVGNPVLISTRCCFPEVEQVEAGFCVQPKRETLRQGLAKLLEMSPDELLAMGRKGRELVRHNYTWNIAVGKLLTVYHAILNRNEIPLHPEPYKNQHHP